MLAYLRQARIGRPGDIAVAGFMLLALSVMLVPLPAAALDVLIAINLIAALTLLLLAIHIPTPSRLASFPSILLLTTLLRLSLNVASTRLILASGQGSAIVTAFATLVTGGDLFVGLILFVIVTVVQFMVIAKGSERVAEVAARFTLDAMPGKQMSIDADLRSGNIEFDEGARRREGLQVESQLYGAMDGAMKFVKGDAVAGLIITAINLVGGIIIGVSRLDMSAAEAGSTFAALTVGDGLVSQIPAMLISVAAGFMTTAVNEGEQNLGARLEQQLRAFPRAPAVAGAFLVVLAFVPGMPGWVLATVGIATVAGAVHLIRRETLKAFDDEDEAPAEPEVTKAEVKIARMQRATADRMLPMVTPVLIEFSKNLEGLLGDPRGRFVRDLIPEMRNGLFFELGMRFPNVRMRVNPWLEESDCYVVYINEIPGPVRKLRRDRILVNESPNRLRAFNVRGQPVENPATGTTCAWVEPKYRAVLERACFECWSGEEFVILDLAEQMRRNASRFLSVHDVKEMLNHLQSAFPALVDEIVPRLISVPQLTDVLRRLVSESISIRDQKSILQSIAEWAPVLSRPEDLVAAVRRDLRDYITYKYAGVGESLAAYVLDPVIEDTVRGGILEGPEGRVLALDPDIVNVIVRAVRNAVEGTRHRDQLGPVFLTTSSVRPFVRRLLEFECPRLRVVSYDELRPNVVVEPLGRVSIDDEMGEVVAA
ncbi:MAG: flagellar biosynthesis protein FlhA [Deltaproteobacteria bacterium]